MKEPFAEISKKHEGLYMVIIKDKRKKTVDWKSHDRLQAAKIWAKERAEKIKITRGCTT